MKGFALSKEAIVSEPQKPDEKPKRQPGKPAGYGQATPEEVVKTLVTQRPKPKTP